MTLSTYAARPRRRNAFIASLAALALVAGSMVGFAQSASAAGTITAVTPKISGDVRVDSTVTADPGAWKPSGLKFAYQWYLDDAPISGATKSSYKIPISALNGKLRVEVTGSKSGYTSKTAKSKTVTIKAGEIPLVSKPVVKGNPKVGNELTGTPGKWGVSGLKIAYQWLRNGQPIAGATTNKYTPSSPADNGQQLSIEVTVSKNGYRTKTSRSAWTAAVEVDDELFPGDKLTPGKYLMSQNGFYKLIMQTDGNLVLYNASGALWSSKTQGTNFYSIMQSDGNWVVTNPVNRADVWDSKTFGNPGAVLRVQDDGNVVIYVGKTPIWSRSVVGYVTTTGPDGAPGMSTPNLPPKGKKIKQYKANTVLGVTCYRYGQTVTGNTGIRSNLWHKVFDGNFVPAADLIAGPIPGEPLCR